MGERVPGSPRGRHPLRYAFAAAAASRRCWSHPPVLVGVVIVDGLVVSGGNDVRLTCYGALEVSMTDGEPVFVSHHRSTMRDEDRPGLLADLGVLSRNRHVVLGSSHPCDIFLDRRHVLRDGLNYIDILAWLGSSVQPADLTLLTTPERSLDEIASSFGVPRSRGSDTLSMARLAAARAQLAWLSYVQGNASAHYARNLFAAFSAWRIIERARPLAFP